jgi:excinuclease UvrABC nuclease subunit
MSNASTLDLTGSSGKKYKFYVYELGTSFKKVGGVYAITKRTSSQGSNSHSVIYIGKTDDLSERFDNHHKQDCVDKNGANRICVRQVESEADRDSIEKDLIKNYQPKCNEQLK